MKQPDVDSVRYRLVPICVQVQVVSGIILGERLCRMVWISDRRIEIEDRIVRPASSNPLIEHRPLCFSLGSPVVRAFKWRERRSIDLEAP